MNFLVPQAVGLQPKLPVLDPPPQYLFCFLSHPSNTFCSNEERTELWLRLWKSAPEKGRQKRGKASLSSNPDPIPTHSYTSSAEKQNQTHSPRPIFFWHLAWGSRIETHILPLFMQSNILIFLDLESNCSHFSSHHTTQNIFVNQIVNNTRTTPPKTVYH